SAKVETVKHARQRSAEGSVRALAADAVTDQVSEYTTGLEGFFGSAVDPEEVLSFARAVMANDAFADGVAAIREMGTECATEGTHITLTPSTHPVNSVFVA